MSKEVDYSGLVNKDLHYPMTPEECREVYKRNEISKQWIPFEFPKPSRLERLLGAHLYRNVRDFVRSIPYWRWKPCNNGCFLTCKGHVNAGVLEMDNDQGD